MCTRFKFISKFLLSLTVNKWKRKAIWVTNFTNLDYWLTDILGRGLTTCSFPKLFVEICFIITTYCFWEVFNSWSLFRLIDDVKVQHCIVWSTKLRIMLGIHKVEHSFMEIFSVNVTVTPLKFKTNSKFNLLWTVKNTL